MKKRYSELMRKIGDLSLIMRLLRQHIGNINVADLSDRQILILEILARMDGEMNTEDLIAYLGFPQKSAISAAIGFLERELNLIETCRNPDDHRKRTICLTSKGANVVRERKKQSLNTYAPLAVVIRKIEKDIEKKQLLNELIDEVIEAIEIKLGQLKNKK